MKYPLFARAAIFTAAALLLLFSCAKIARSDQQTEQAKSEQHLQLEGVENYPIDAKPLPAILPVDKTLPHCPLVARSCSTEESTQAKIAIIRSMIAGTGFTGQEQAIYDATEKYGVNPKLLIGIANAESSVGLHCKWNNCFGIMAHGHVLRSYPTLAAGIMDAARFLRERVYSKGRFTPEQIVHGYVGHDAPWWVKNVNKYYRNYENTPN